MTERDMKTVKKLIKKTMEKKRYLPSISEFKKMHQDIITNVDIKEHQVKYYILSNK